MKKHVSSSYYQNIAVAEDMDYLENKLLVYPENWERHKQEVKKFRLNRWKQKTGYSTRHPVD